MTRTTHHQLLTAFICLFTLTHPGSFAQSGGPAGSARGSGYNFVSRTWNNSSGLPQNTVYQMVQDSTGYLWGATEEGLFRFDGKSFRVFDETNTPNIGSSTFYDVIADGAGVWASGRTSLLRIGHNVQRNYDVTSLSGGGWITTIEKDALERIWIGTSNGRLLILDDDTLTPVPGWRPLQALGIESLRWGSGRMAIGTDAGLFLMPDPSSPAEEVMGLHGVQVMTIQGGLKGDWWVGTTGLGVIHLSGKDTSSIRERDGLKQNSIYSLLLEKSGKLWIGFVNSGYQVYEDGRLIAPVQPEVEHDGVRSMLGTGNSVMWMGTNTAGLIQLRPALIKLPPVSMENSGKIMLGVWQHPSGEIWMGTAGRGLERYKDGRLTVIDKSNGLPNNLVFSIMGRKEHVYVGTGDGLSRIDLASGRIDRQFTTDDGLRNNGIFCLYKDSRNRIWVGTRQAGLHRLDETDDLTDVPLPASMSAWNTLCVFEDRQGGFWIGTRGGGVIHLDANDGHPVQYNGSNGFPGQIVYGFYQDAEGDVWMLSEKGLISYSKGRFKLFTKQQGLFGNECYRIIADSAGHVWMSGNLGLQRVAIRDLLAAKHSTDSSYRMPVRLFNSFDGMPNPETNGGFYPAGWAMLDGTIWFPTVLGIAIADHRLVNQEENHPGIVLEYLRYGSTEQFPGEEIRIAPGALNFEIHYTSIDFSKSSDITFGYRLLGQSNEWVDADNRRVAYFSELLPGDYVFEVRAERYGIMSPVARMHFRVQPHFWQALWFKVMLVGLLTALALGAIWSVRRRSRQQIRQQQHITRAQISGQEKERQFISSELHDSVNQQLTTAKLYLDFAKTNEGMRVELIEKSEMVVQSVIDDIRNLCNSLTPPSLKDIGLKAALKDLVHSYTTVGKFIIHYKFDLDPEMLEEDLQFVIFRVTQEQMHNVVRHSAALHVWLELSVDAEGLQIVIRDDGHGFDPRTEKYGMGFENIRTRLLLFDGTMQINTAPGRGCELVLRIPLKS